MGGRGIRDRVVAKTLLERARRCGGSARDAHKIGTAGAVGNRSGDSRTRWDVAGNDKGVAGLYGPADVAAPARGQRIQTLHWVRATRNEHSLTEAIRTSEFHVALREKRKR